MGSAAIPTQSVSKTKVGNTTVASPILLLKVNGVVYANGYREDYGSSGFRNIFPVYDPNNGDVSICCHAVAAGADLAAITISNLEVDIIG